MRWYERADGVLQPTAESSRRVPLQSLRDFCAELMRKFGLLLLISCSNSSTSSFSATPRVRQYSRPCWSKPGQLATG